MAATLVEEYRIPIGQSRSLVAGTITMDDSYPAGGEAIDGPGDGYERLVISPAAGYVPEFVKAEQKVLVRVPGVAIGSAGSATLDDFPLSGAGATATSIGLANDASSPVRFGPCQEVAATTDLSAVTFSFIGIATT